MGNLAKLSSVYYKLPETFIKKIRENQEKEEFEAVGDLLG